MEWDDLRYFLAVARSGQLVRASSLVGADATTVSRHIRRLERSLAQTLFEQTREGQTLTEAGEQLLPKAEAIERYFAEIAEGGAARQGVSGLVRVSVSEGFGTWLVARHLHTFLDQHPRALIDLVANSGFLNPSRRETDVAVLLARPKSGPLISRKLSDYALQLYASRTYLETHGRIDNRADLSGHSLIGYIPDFVYSPELLYLDEIAPKLDLRARSSSINAQYQLAVSGAGAAILPCFIGDADDRLIRLLADLRIVRSFWLVTHADTRRLARIEAFVSWLEALVTERRGLLLGDRM